jgi:hypothetical protein
VRLELGQSARRRKFHQNAVMASIARGIAGRVPEQVTIPKIDDDFIREI